MAQVLGLSGSPGSSLGGHKCRQQEDRLAFGSPAAVASAICWAQGPPQQTPAQGHHTEAWCGIPVLPNFYFRRREKASPFCFN